jgi:hypothetical protein
MDANFAAESRPSSTKGTGTKRSMGRDGLPQSAPLWARSAESVSTAERHNLFVREAHSVEDLEGSVLELRVEAPLLNDLQGGVSKGLWLMGEVPRADTSQA